MSPTEKLAVNIARKAKIVLDVDEDKEQTIIYGAINLLQITFAILWVIIIGLLLGVLYEALIFSIVVGILRKYSGGVHASSPSHCIIIGTILAAIAGIIIDKLFYKLTISTVVVISIFCVVAALIIVFENAPVDSINKPITNIEMKRRFKGKSILVILIFSLLIMILFVFHKTYLQVYYITAIESITLGILWQSITLTKIGRLAFNKVDFVLKYIIERGNYHEK